jgi:hypothetical protein
MAGDKEGKINIIPRTKTPPFCKGNLPGPPVVAVISLENDSLSLSASLALSPSSVASHSGSLTHFPPFEIDQMGNGGRVHERGNLKKPDESNKEREGF